MGTACFWANRAADSVRREKQLLIDFLCANAGGPLYSQDWDAFIGRVHETLNKFGVPPRERAEVLGFIDGLKSNIVEA